MLTLTQNNLRLQPLGLPSHPHSTHFDSIGFQQPQYNNIPRESRIRKFQWYLAPWIQNVIGIQDWTFEFDRRLALVVTINLSHSKCLMRTTYHVRCSPHDLVHQHGKCKNYGTTPMMLQGMKKTLQSMKYLQNTKPRVNIKVLEPTTFILLIKGAQFQKIHLSSKCCECQILNN